MLGSRRGIITCALALVAAGSLAGNALAADHDGITASAPSERGDTLTTEIAAINQAKSSTPYTEDRSNRTAAGVLKDIFVRAGTIDGKPIKNFQLRTRCQTAFVTADNTIVIDWSHVGNYAGRYADGRESFAIDDGQGSHTIAVPAGKHPEPLGNAGARVDSGMSSIADTCQS